MTCSRVSPRVSRSPAARAACSSPSDIDRSHFGSSASSVWTALASPSLLMLGKRTLVTLSVSTSARSSSLSICRWAVNQKTPKTGALPCGSQERAARPVMTTPSSFSTWGW